MRFSDFDTYLRADHLQHSTTVTIESFQRIETRPPARSDGIRALRAIQRKAKAAHFERSQPAEVGRNVRRRHRQRSARASGL